MSTSSGVAKRDALIVTRCSDMPDAETAVSGCTKSACDLCRVDVWVMPQHQGRTFALTVCLQCYTKMKNPTEAN